MNNQASYTAASAVPAKLFSEDETVAMVREHRIKPLHVQTNITNSCPLQCSFCSCRNMDRTAKMDFGLLKEISQKLIDLGAEAFTQTGGGDPLAYEHLETYFGFLLEKGMEISLVTNGILFKNYDPKFFRCLSWCRISLSDERTFRPAEIDPVIEACKTDWSFSYVLLDKANIANIITAIEYANAHEFSHVRVVDDIVGGSDTMGDIKETLKRHKIDTSRVVWQGRKNYTKGHARCLLSLLKPNVDVYGNLTGCCGVQFASDPPMLDFTRAFRVCDMDSIDRTYAEQKYFKGSICQRCYYTDYNNILNAEWISGDLRHGKFK